MSLSLKNKIKMQLSSAETAMLQQQQAQQVQQFKPKNYKIKIAEWYCPCCDIYCNSKSQFEVHMVSTKHSQVEKRVMTGGTSSNGGDVVDNNNNNTTTTSTPLLANNNDRHKPIYTFDQNQLLQLTNGNSLEETNHMPNNEEIKKSIY